MPTSTALPRPLVSYPYRYSYPGTYEQRRSRENFRSPNDNQRGAMTGGPGGVNQGPNEVTVLGQSESGATAGDLFRNIDGVVCSFTSIGPRGWGWTFPWWQARFDGSAVPAGVRTPEGAVVAVIDASWRPLFGASPDADMVGIWIGGGLDASSAANYRNNTPGGASAGLDTGGAGILQRVDGTGFDYVCWGIGGAVAERVPIVVTPTQWNTFRFILTSAPAGGFAALSIALNGEVTPTIERTYGTAATPVPYSADAAATGDPVFPALAFTGTALNSAGWGYCFDAKWGRFLPDGTEVEAE